jgi:hypothetical protein
METLTDVQNYLNNIECICEGGCGIAALAMYRWLKKNDEVKDVKFVFLYVRSSTCNYNHNEEVLEHNLKGVVYPVAPSHVIIKKNERMFDCRGEFNDTHIDPFDDTIYALSQEITDEEFLVKTVQNEQTWNSSFDRENICDIVATLDVDLYDVFETTQYTFN